MPHKVVTAACSFPYCITHGCIDKTKVKQCSIHGGLKEIPEEQAREMLDHHLGHPGELGESEFTSWSCSLLAALVHAIRKYEWGHPNVEIYVLDTRLIKKQIYKATDLVTWYKLKGRWDLMVMCQGEYLIHGVLQTPRDCTESFFQKAKLDDLIKEGLLEQLPKLADPLSRERTLLVRMEDTRAKLFASDAGQSLSFDDAFSIRNMSDCFTGNFAFVFAIAFVSTRRRVVIQDRLHDRLYDLLESAGTKADTKVFCPWPESSIDVTLPEATQFERLLDEALDIKWFKQWDANEAKRRLG